MIKAHGYVSNVGQNISVGDFTHFGGKRRLRQCKPKAPLLVARSNVRLTEIETGIASVIIATSDGKQQYYIPKNKALVFTVTSLGNIMHRLIPSRLVGFVRFEQW